MKKKLLISFLIILIAIFIVFIVIKKQKNKPKEINSVPITYEEKDEKEIEEKHQTDNKIETIISEQGFEADSDMYEVTTEYDGREIAVIKSSIQYKTALSGIIKENKPEFSDINQLLEQAPKHSGIWVAKNARDKFLGLLKKITNNSYKIDEDGFLVQASGINPNKQDKVISRMISDGKLYIFDINSVTYLVDEVTGEIQEYPFEDMDPDQGYEYFQSDDKYLFIISENNQGKINQEEELKNIILKY